MGDTHSSQHTAPDAKCSSTCCCQTHEVWELPTSLIVANRSQQGDEDKNVQHRTYTKMQGIHNSKHNHPCSIQSCKTSSHPYLKSSELQYPQNSPRNIDLTLAKPNTDTSSGTVAQKLRIGSYELNQICPTLLTRQKALDKAQDYRREMSSQSLKAPRKLQKAVPNEASEQEESNATTLTSIGAAYRRQSEKIWSGEQLLGYRDRIRYREIF
ncbi:mediator of RNA polymerase II transcription subunit 16 [Dorcoceras hygrometricum]|uniref:Mediator of RNA polymerase II transcription subunit 16 n=1 Tax=Dorcoceras hygrometricum TaxID=472368 RepID=A0A2Z7BZU4_9LAMI|nr:mediator of RNA polymerase II transcription subunit 16 [Dorcoceras hygrometricum]